MKAVCWTNVDKSAKSSIQRDCYPDSVWFKTSATMWGCDHEKDALESYQKQIETTHDGFRMETSGFVNSDTFPFIGASPDCCCKGNVHIV